ncbi:hypothetical protein BDM02DRAFT_2999977 [Thelephora ganbajun]|uniref:Uncharacterized protein n=1 Tax=Thelephora ganbajun TaxID=370292 RepID=A0ACB6YXL2_THEGA|nr:hypothetical protein BDM02DRAFT_2999977 [Thelephora ganbajun]
MAPKTAPRESWRSFPAARARPGTYLLGKGLSIICGTELEEKFKHRHEGTGRERVVTKGGLYVGSLLFCFYTYIPQSPRRGARPGNRCNKWEGGYTRHDLREQDGVSAAQERACFRIRVRQRIENFETLLVLTAGPKRAGET